MHKKVVTLKDVLKKFYSASQYRIYLFFSQSKRIIRSYNDIQVISEVEIVGCNELNQRSVYTLILDQSNLYFYCYVASLLDIKYHTPFVNVN